MTESVSLQTNDFREIPSQNCTLRVLFAAEPYLAVGFTRCNITTKMLITYKYSCKLQLQTNRVNHWPSAGVINGLGRPNTNRVDFASPKIFTAVGAGATTTSTLKCNLVVALLKPSFTWLWSYLTLLLAHTIQTHCCFGYINIIRMISRKIFILQWWFFFFTPSDCSVFIILRELLAQTGTKLISIHQSSIIRSWSSASSSQSR